MIALVLIKHEWQKSLRAQGFYKNLAVNILLAFFGLYIAAVLLFLGFSLDNILEKAHNSLNPLELFNGATLYIFIAGLAFRFLMQQLNSINLPPYQILPIKRSSLINFLLLKPLMSPVNYLLLLVIIPFAIQSVMHYYSLGVTIQFVCNFILMVWFNSLMASFLKRKFGAGLISFIIIIVFIAGIIALEYFKIFSIFDFSSLLFNFIVLKQFGFLVPVAMVFIAFLLNKWFFYQNFYPENFNLKMADGKVYNSNFTFLNRFGVIGELISIEIKLILRHKRTRSLLIMSGFFLFYGLIFYTKDIYANSNGMLFFVAMFITGLLMFLYGQWVVSWDSSHFDSLMSKNISIKTYLKANYYLLLAFNLLCFILTTPYFFFGPKIILMHIAAFLFNIGVNIFLLLFLSTYNTKKIDLSKSSAMNYQGTTFKSFLIVLPIMFVPMILVSTLTLIFSTTTALIILGCLGTLGFIFRNQLLNLCVLQFNKRKYKLAEGFRESE